MKLSELMREEFSTDVDSIDRVIGAITARLHECVKPLKWRAQSYKAPEQIGHHAKSYSIYESAINGKCVVSSGPPFFFGPYHYDNLEAAKAAAQAHHAAQITEGLDLSTDPLKNTRAALVALEADT